MGRGDLSDQEWARLEPHLPMNVGRGGRWKSHRRVINGILFRQRTGIPWRDLPARFGKWKTVHDRHRRWSGDGTWEKILRAVQADADEDGRIDWSMVSVDSTSCRAHQHAAGARAAAPRGAIEGSGADGAPPGAVRSWFAFRWVKRPTESRHRN
ncbi:IS5 family transposase [Streptomyces sp. NBC_00656]